MEASTQTPKYFYKAHPRLASLIIQVEKLEQELRARRVVTQDCIYLGKNGTQLHSDLYRGINWSNYKSATNELSYLVFGHEVLGTHSLTGRAGPWTVLKKRGVKPPLDPKHVADIVEHIRIHFQATYTVDPTNNRTSPC
ncbi:early boundary activity protein 2-like [Drosophila busckii]|uniref:early boundary activity protein 2-like n=1 Tax=Drosophila busckii TaxID=30019 RepID=UPI00083EEB09|nr:early boundary activity protein 2-like [Drosophila busckii]